MPGLLPDDEAKTVSDTYEQSTPLGTFKKEIKKLNDLSLADGEDDWKKILTMLHDFYAKIVAAV